MAWIRSFGRLLICVATASGCLPPEIPVLGDASSNAGGANGAGGSNGGTTGGSNGGMTGGGEADHGTGGSSAGGSANHTGGSTNATGGTPSVTPDARPDSTIVAGSRNDASSVAQDAVIDTPAAMADGHQDAPANAASDASDAGAQGTPDASPTSDAPADGPCVPNCQSQLGPKCDTTDGCGGPCLCPAGMICLSMLCAL